MPYKVRIVDRPGQPPRSVVFENFKEFIEMAPRDAQYLTHSDAPKKKKFVKPDTFNEIAVEVAEGTAPPQEFSHAEALVEAATKGDSNPAPATKTPSAKPLPSATPQPVAAAPPMNFDALGKALSDAITNSVQGSTGKAAEAWTAALKAAVEESNTQLKQTLEKLSAAYLEVCS